MAGGHGPIAGAPTAAGATPATLPPGPVPNAGPKFGHAVTAIPGGGAGPVLRAPVISIPGAAAGPKVGYLVTSFPGQIAGPSLDQTLVALIPEKFGGPALIQPMRALLQAASGPALDQTLETDLSAFGPTIVNPTAVQRDTAQTFLVDVSGEITDPSGDDVNLSLEWARDPSGPWTAATLQTTDRRHTANPITGVPAAEPGAPFNLVWQAFFDLPEGTWTDVYLRITAEDI